MKNLSQKHTGAPAGMLLRIELKGGRRPWSGT